MSEISEKTASFKSALKDTAQLVNKKLSEILDGQHSVQDRLTEAMSYTIKTPGKRVRPAVVLWSSRAAGGDYNDDALTAAACVEIVHTYSLIHDDLPDMDDDDLRRGKPSCHKAFDNATAILTGDALLTLAFETLAKDISEPSTAVRMIRTLAAAAGPAGMVSGQMADLVGEKSTHNLKLLDYIHMNKTAKMFTASAALGGLAAKAKQPIIDALSRYGTSIGLGFQIADDLLDISASSDQLGKTAGKDQAAGKLTYPSLIGVERSQHTAEKLTEQALNALSGFDDNAQPLRELAQALLNRTK